MGMTPDEARVVNENTKRMSSHIGDKAGHGFVFGSSLAMIISWSVNKSIIWALAHGLFSWAYIIYYAVGLGR